MDCQDSCICKKNDAPVRLFSIETEQPPFFNAGCPLSEFNHAVHDHSLTAEVAHHQRQKKTIATEFSRACRTKDRFESDR